MFCFLGFFKAVVTPLFTEWHRFMQSPLSTHMNQLLESNRHCWEAQERVEQAEETQTELSDAEADVIHTYYIIRGGSLMAQFSISPTQYKLKTKSCYFYLIYRLKLF